MNLFNIKNLVKIYENPGGTKLSVLENINLSIEDPGYGFICSVLAPFGAGKSSLMKIIAGIENPTSGKVLLFNEDVHRQGIKIPYLPEKPSSFPWLTVKGNIDFALKINQIKKKEILNAETLINHTGLTGYENHIPINRSYGFRFRIALARALAINSKIILIDDSFKVIEQSVKIDLYNTLKNIASAMNKVFILATTDISEAIILSDLIFLMKKKPGFIFKTISSDHSGIDAESEKFTSIKSEIEKSLSSEAAGNTITLSV